MYRNVIYLGSWVTIGDFGDFRMKVLSTNRQRLYDDKKEIVVRSPSGSRWFFWADSVRGVYEDAS